MSAATPRLTEPAVATLVLNVARQFRASETAVVEAAPGRHLGVLSVEVNPVAQTATVHYDPSLTSVRELRRAVEHCGFECAGARRD